MHADVERISELACRPPVRMLGCLLYDERGDYYLEYSEWGWRRELCWIIVQWFLLPREISMRRPDPRLPKTRLWISGAAFLVRRTEFWDVGGFDDEIFLYFEDVDLSRRYRDHGTGVGTTDAIVVTHEGQGSVPRDHEQIQGWALLSLLELVAKWHGQQEGERAARAVLRMLDAISTIAQIVGTLPLLGQRAIAKAQSAALVRSALLACVNTPPVATTYPRARVAIAAVTQAPNDACAY